MPDSKDYPELLPCPFCGCETTYLQSTMKFGPPMMHGVQCKDCGMSTPWVKTEDEANARWNRRTQESPASQEVDPIGRTPKDYAIEHAEYMARAGECLLEDINVLHGAQQRLEDFEGDESAELVVEAETAIFRAQENLSDAMSAMRNRIHGFRRRRDRASLPTQQPPSSTDRVEGGASHG